jgi:hypothetical protein
MTRFEKYRDHFPNARLTRSQTGVLEVALHTDGGTLVFNGHTHEQFVDLFQAIGSDPDNRVVILTGSGDAFMESISPEGFDFFTPQGLQGQVDRYSRDRSRARRALRSRTQRAERGQPGPDQRAAHRRRERRPSLGRMLRQALSRPPRCAGRGLRAVGPRHPRGAHRGREQARSARAWRRPRFPRSHPQRLGRRPPTPNAAQRLIDHNSGKPGAEPRFPLNWPRLVKARA